MNEGAIYGANRWALVKPVSAPSAAKAESPPRRSGDGVVLSIRGLSCSFGPTQALASVDLDLSPGEVVALLGKNGAGKSTLIKILAGVYQPTAGTYQVDGKAYDEGLQPEDLRGAEIAFVHQDLGLIPALSVAENIAHVSGFQTRNGLISWSKQRQAAVEALEKWGFDIDPDLPVAALDQAEKALVAITRALSTNAPVVVFDEPTAALPRSDVDTLFRAIERIRAAGVAVLYVTHRLDEVSALADRVAILRDGHLVMDAPVAEVEHNAMVDEIVGETLVKHSSDYRSDSSEVVLSLSGATCGGARGVDLEVRSGEIVALVGLVSGGQRSVGKMLGGVDPLEGGRMTLNGADYAPKSPRDALRSGVAYLSSSRQEAGFFLFDTGANFGLRRTDSRLLNRKQEAREAGEVFAGWGITPSDPTVPLGALSGGNQQRVLLSKWVEFGPSLLVVDEPSAGVDIGARQAVHERLDQVAHAGVPVVVVSSDAEETAELAHRAIIFDYGVVAAELEHTNLTAERITLESSRDSTPMEVR